MSKIRISLFIIATLICLNSLSQKRIGLDLSTDMLSLNLTVNYHQVIKNRWLFSTGAFYGAMGVNDVEHDVIEMYGDETILTPYSEANQVISDSITSYSILEYRTRATAVGVQAGLGFYYEFDVKHGLRSNLYAKIGYAKTKLAGTYRSIETNTEKLSHSMAYHFYGGISLELSHTIRITGRTTFYYGFKLPYNFTIDKGKFNPQSNQDLFAGFEPEMSIGFTRVIGKCD